MFIVFFEGVEATVKGYYLAGKISRADKTERTEIFQKVSLHPSEFDLYLLVLK